MVHRPRFFVIFILIAGLFLLAACQSSPTLVPTQAPGLSPTIPPTHTPRATPTPAPTSTWTATATTIPSPTSTATLVPTPTATPTRSPQQAQEILSSHLEEYASTVEKISYTMTSSNTIEITTADWDGNPVVSEAFQINDRGMAEFSAFPPLSPTGSITPTSETHELSPDSIHFDAKFNKLVAVDDEGIATHVFYPYEGGVWLNVGYGAGTPRHFGECWALPDFEYTKIPNPQGVDAQGNPLPDEQRLAFMIGENGLVTQEKLLQNIFYGRAANVNDLNKLNPFAGLEILTQNSSTTSCVVVGENMIIGKAVEVNGEKGILHIMQNIPHTLQWFFNMSEGYITRDYFVNEYNTTGKTPPWSVINIFYPRAYDQSIADRLPGVGEMWKEQGFYRLYYDDKGGYYEPGLVNAVDFIFVNNPHKLPLKISDISNIVFPGAVVAINQ